MPSNRLVSEQSEIRASNGSFTQYTEITEDQSVLRHPYLAKGAQSLSI